jgi:hypothetical protein
MTTLIEEQPEEVEIELPKSLRSAVKPHTSRFLNDAKKYGLKLSPAGFQEWDAVYNLDRVRKLLTDRYNTQQLADIGLRIVFMRVFYSCVQAEFNAKSNIVSALTPLITGDESTAPPPYCGSAVLKGLDRRGPLTADEKNILCERAMNEFIRWGKELSRYLTPSKLRKLLEEKVL